MRTSGEKDSAFVRRLLAWGRANRRAFPWRDEADAFRVLVAEVLLQRSRGSTVTGVYHELFKRWPTPERLSRAEEGEIRDVIRPLGLTGRAASLKKIAAIAGASGIPSTVEGMTALPGVGRYAASAAAAVLGNRVPTVDGTSARVYRRYFGLSGERDSEVNEELWSLVEEVAPTRPSAEWNWAVLDLAASICLPRLPRCHHCPLEHRCARASESRQSVGAAL